MAKARLITTFHCDVTSDRYTRLQRTCIDLSIALAHCPLLLNDSSFAHGHKINKNAKYVTAFIAPNSIPDLSEPFASLIKEARSRYKLIAATCAFDFVFDKNGREIYGIVDLVAFAKKNNLFLVVSDPSGKYSAQFEDVILDNILFITKAHEFMSVITLADVSFRNTTTDGDALSVRESLMLGVTTFATGVVSRPEGVIVFDKLDEVEIADIHKKKSSVQLGRDCDGFFAYLDIYRQQLAAFAQTR